MTNKLSCFYSCQQRAFWKFLTINLFSLYAMSFMFYTKLDAAGNILKLHYNSIWNVMFQFHKVAYVRYLGEVLMKRFLSAYSSAKFIFKNRTKFSRIIITNVPPLFYETHQCISRRTFVLTAKILLSNASDGRRKQLTRKSRLHP